MKIKQLMLLSHDALSGMPMLRSTILFPKQLLHLQFTSSPFCKGLGHWCAQQLRMEKEFWFTVVLESTGVAALRALCS
jgi:hypothetical protein